MKTVVPSLEIIENQFKSRSVILTNNETWIHGKSGIIKKERENGYTLRIVSDFSLPNFERNFKNTIFNDGTEYLIPSMNITSTNGSTRMKGSVSTFHISEYGEDREHKENDNHYFRLLIPIYEDNYISLMRIFETTGYTSEISSGCFEYFDFTIRERNFEIYIIIREGQKYLAIDCNDLIDYITFDHICFSILLSFSLFSGKFVQGDLFFLTSINKDHQNTNLFKYREMEKTSNNHYCMFAPNPHGVIKDPMKASKINKDVLRLNKNQFETMVSLVYTNDKVANLLLISHQAMQLSLTSMPITLSVCLEILGTISEFKGEESIKKPINNGSLSKRLNDDLLSVLMKYKDEILKDGGLYDTLESKIKNINNPLNSDKLTEPFEYFKIPLTEKDQSSIRNRNRILHGSKLLKYYSNDSEHKETDDLFKTSLNIYFLISCVFMKYINYSGYLFDIRNVVIEFNSGDEDLESSLFIKLT